MRSPGFFSRFCFRTRVDGYGVFFVFRRFRTFDVAGHLSDLAETCCAGRLRAGGARHRRIVTRTAGAMQAAHAGRARRPRAAGARGPKRCTLYPCIYRPGPTAFRLGPGSSAVTELPTRSHARSVEGLWSPLLYNVWGLGLLREVHDSCMLGTGSKLSQKILKIGR